METALNLIFSLDGASVRIETTLHDAGDSNLVLLSVSATLGIGLRSAYDYEEGRDRIAVMDHWRLRGAGPAEPEFRVLHARIEVGHTALRADCLYDHLARLVGFAEDSGQALAVSGVDLALTELDRPDSSHNAEAPAKFARASGDNYS